MIDDLLALFGGRTQPVMAHLIESGQLTLEDVKEAEKTLRKLERKDNIEMTPANLSAMWSDIGPALGNHLWQSTLFAGAAGLLALTLRKNQARARYWVWLAASVKFLIPFSLLVAIGNRLAWSHATAGTNAGLYCGDGTSKSAVHAGRERHAGDFSGRRADNLAEPVATASGATDGDVARRIRCRAFYVVRPLAAGCCRHARRQRLCARGAKSKRCVD